MKQGLVLISTLILLGLPAWGTNDGQPWPEKALTAESQPISYQIIKLAFFNFEKFLKETLKMESQICQYTSLVQNKTYNYPETGACIYRLLLDSVKSQSPQSPVFIWAKTIEGQPLLLRLDWHPQFNNFMEVYTQLMEMKFEKPIHYYNKRAMKFLKIDFEKRGYGSSTSLVGQISITLKSQPETVQNLMALVSDPLAQHIKVDKISVELSPHGRHKDYLNHKISVKIWPSETSEFSHFQLTTNVNLLDPSRTFIIRQDSK